MADPTKKQSFNLYLQTRPEESERHKVKEMMIQQLRVDRTFGDLGHRKSMLSLMSGDSRYNDSELQQYAEAIENFKKNASN